MRVWITKYALSKGIYQTEVVTSHRGAYTIHGYRQQFWHSGEWHESLESAVAAAKRMRERKIMSLEEQLKRLRSLEFDLDAIRKTAG